MVPREIGQNAAYIVASEERRVTDLTRGCAVSLSGIERVRNGTW